LIPYGIVGYLASRISGIPFIIRHGGSDLAKFWKERIFGHLLQEVIQNASLMLSDDKNKELFKNFVHPANMPDLLANVDFILSFFRDNPIRDFSNIVCEALWSGIRLITDKTLSINEYTKYIEIEPEKQIINLAPGKIEAA